MRVKRTDVFQAMQFIRQLVEGEMKDVPATGGPRLSPDDYLPVLRRTLEQEKFEFEGKWRVPITYTIRIPTVDMEFLENRGLREEMPPILTRKLADYAKSKNYVAAKGAITVIIEATDEEETRVIPDFKPRTGTPQTTPGQPKQNAPAPIVTGKTPGQPDPHGTVLFKAPVAEIEISAVDNPSAVQKFSLSIFPVTIGREAPDNSADIQFEAHPEVSRQHIRIQREGNGSFTVTHLSSLNGTTLNGKELTPKMPTDLPPDATLILAEQVRIRFIDIHGTRRAR